MHRRSFLTTLGASGAGVLAAPFISWRGHEIVLAQGAAARRADRLLAARPGMIRIDSNENPNGPGERVYAVIRRHLTESNRYPVQSEDDLAAAIAKTHGISPDNLILGCGSGELLRAAVSAFTTRDRALVAPEPTFEAPANWAKFIGSPVVAPRVDALLHLDLDAMAEQGRGAGLCYLCNPNNPTATVHGRSAVNAYVERVGKLSPETTVLIDEAYFEYVDEPSYGSAIPLALSNPRVVVTRTFSKVFGMAGLRVGYAVGQPVTLAKLAAWLLGSNISQLSLVAAAAAVGDVPHIVLEQRRNRATRAFTRRFFEQAGYRVAQSEANFMMVDIRRDAKEFKLECLKHHVAVGRQFPTLPTHVRVSIGTMEEMQKALRVFQSLLA
ncbi:MAG TPA: aminotransferase class I/II-fold pyridoxal phosphate-dependent enzyme [Gemmatimonadales bacterium]|jgi:histidinol-phosphate aminotransferase|nr:aminotransferase class I/II-fold pyridoxal phosphate-dependent enzyme [Gemmatimonadales bacterium]